MTQYNPFERGSIPVGTGQFSWTDPSREHTLPADIWYPATQAYRGQDLDPATMNTFAAMPGMGETQQQAVMDADAASGAYPLVVFFHGFGGERRQSTFFYTHLASHGYVVDDQHHGLLPGSHADALINGLDLAHFDANLEGRGAASAMMASDLVALMAEQGNANGVL